MHLIMVDGIPLQLNHIHCCGWRKALKSVVVEEGRRRRGREGMGNYSIWYIQGYVPYEPDSFLITSLGTIIASRKDVACSERLLSPTDDVHQLA